MKFLKMLAALLSIKEVAQKENKVELSNEQSTKLTELLGDEQAQLLIEQANAELAKVKSVKEELSEVKYKLEQSSEDIKAKEDKLGALTTKVDQLLEENKDLKAKVEKLSGEPEDVVKEVVKQVKEIGVAEKVFEQGGQLFGLQGKFWEASSPWNAKALAGAKGSTTDFKSFVVIQRMNDEFLDYVRTYPEKIESLFNSYFNLPEHWPRITGVMDRLMSATISVANVTQPRKARWAPKGDIVFKAEEMFVRPTQIDLQFNYWEMQKIETNWLNGFNKVGNQAYKMPFIVFLLGEFLKKARQEDADVLIRGVWVPTPEEREKDKPGHYLHRNDGLLKLIFDARLANKYRPFNLGRWTFANALDYVDSFIKQLPENVRSTEQLQMLMSPSKILDYKRRAEQIHGGNTDYKGYPETPKDYTNIKFVPLQWLEGSDVIIVTTMDNIKVFEYKPEEKSLFTIEKFLRDIYAFADYRIGIGINHIGLATVPGDKLALAKQMIWTNNTPLFNSDFFATCYDNKTGILEVRHNRVKPDIDFTTDIVEITGNVGDILVIRGDISFASEVKVKRGAKLDLTKDFNLKTGGDLTLIKKADGTYKEVSRTTSPALEPTYKSFDTLSLDYKADEYVYKGENGTLEAITGGEEGNRLRIQAAEGKTLTIDTVDGNIKVDSQVILDAPSKFLDLVFVNNVWVEINKG
ncbi:hypothetical protein [Riemerella anatipestifer]|uniref:hypothetical protein n=1 Tax=Riemerella anatipestifer TaxID=34085 RepID=UPI0021F8AE75|nr:hypothetical protein [Riemerella anatipestifer]MCW0511421.1 hypothetical protein [Riemerella anatipestifer]MCW0519896.1 hypothetical protein [Riemerella anatipestifer]MDY3391168.1 hypothetical protein [Riemerella anatipestifer]MDY3519146.1 hypothetical protein [Riemerella anatipestifer]MDY3544083.1 hypothetical protein [Riemerella anatipestifer]